MRLLDLKELAMWKTRVKRQAATTSMSQTTVFPANNAKSRSEAL
jgi:hypothetical protein